MHPPRRQLAERLEHEAPLVHARMRNDQRVLVDAAVGKEQQVEVERPRLAALSAPDPTLLGLDLQQALQQGPRLQSRLDLRDHIQVGALGERPHRVGLVDSRHLEPLNPARCAERLERAPQVGLPVAQVRAERDEGPAHPTSLHFSPARDQDQGRGDEGDRQPLTPV